MGQLENWKMTPLDALLCNNQLQILKTLVFFFPPARQRQIILLIKFMELRQCLSLPLSALSMFSHTADRSEQGTELLEHIFPYCDPQHQQTFKQMQNAFQMMRTVQQFSDSGIFDNLSEMMGGAGGFGGMEAFAQMAGAGGFGGLDGFAQMAGGGGFGGMDGFAQMAGGGSGQPNSSTDDSRPTSDSADDKRDTSPHSNHNFNNDQLGSMLSSMMNPEQQALFKEYEAMLDDL